MDTFVTSLALLVLSALVLAAPVVWWLKELAIDRQLRAAQRAQAGRPARPEGTHWSELHRAVRSRDAFALARDADRD